MREQLQADITELERQISGYKDQLEQTEYGTAKHVAIKDELDKTNAKLVAKQEALSEIDGAAQIAQEELFSQFDNIEVAGLPFSLRDLAKGPDEYSIISAYFQKYVGDMAQQHAAVISSYKSQVERLEDEVQAMDKVRRYNSELSDKLADMEMKRDAAADELFQANEEKGRLAADNESLRKQLESTTKTPNTNINTNAAEIAKKLHDQKPAIYGKRWEDDLKRTSYIANLAETGEEIVIPRLELGKYRELSEEDAARFRAELDNQKAIEAAETARMVEEANNNKTLVIPTLPSKGTGHELDENETVRSDDAPATIGELKALEARIEERLFRLEQSQRGVA